MYEKLLERKLLKAVKAMGAIALKLYCPGGVSGMPDRIVLMKNGRCAFLEVKKKVRSLDRFKS